MHKLIERADTFVLILSPGSIESEMCNWELSHALKNGKRVMPVVCREVDYKFVRKELAPLNWIFFREDGSDFKASLRLIRKALDVERIHALLHTKILNIAINWERNDFEKSLLLGGKDLSIAQKWLTSSALGKEPKPTTLHLSFINASNVLSKSMFKRKLISLFFAFVVIIGIVWPSWGVFFFCLVFAHLFIYLAAH